MGPIDNTNVGPIGRSAFERELVEAHASVMAGLTSGAIVETRGGETPVEWLEAGDEVLTRDRGFQSVLWINRVKSSRLDFQVSPEYAPVVVPCGRIEGKFPSCNMLLSPKQLVMVRSPLAETHFWAREVLVPASALGKQIDPDHMDWKTRTSYAQILLPSHEVIMVNGAWCGSLFTGALCGSIEIANCPLARQLDTPLMTATRPVLTAEEGTVLMQEIDRHATIEDPEAETSRISA